ncbi:rRNA pseudouridine synthase [Patescibacteria group bacterium]|nr:rRNA pseudouridine synthase [Patescibacteria group bacterium]
MSKHSIRINKYLTTAGYCSRRQADRLIEQELVFINGKVASLGQQVEKGDEVRAEGQIVKLAGIKKVYLAFYKPVGVICTTDEKADNNIVDYINYPERVYPVGRLDVATSGLIIMTNDGDLVNKVSRRDSKVEKEYLVKVDKEVNEEFIKQLQGGVDIGGYITLPAKAEKLEDRKISLTIIEGKNQQVRKMCEACGYKVQKLVRRRIGDLTLEGLRPGKYKVISENRIKKYLDIKNGE